MTFLSILLLLSASGIAVGQPVRSHKFIFAGESKDISFERKERTLHINYSLPEAEIRNIFTENGPFFRVTIPGHTPTMAPGKPELPVLSKLISMPEDISFRIRITDVKTEKIKPASRKIEGILYPAQHSEIKSTQKKKPFIIDEGIYKTRGIIASDTVKIIPLGRLRDFNLANLVISPVRYDPKSNQLEVITSMKIEIIFSGHVSMSKSLAPESQLFLEPLSKSILNFNQTDLITGYSDQPVRMIIITDSTYLKALRPFIKWKTQKGYRVEVLTVGPKSAGTTYTEIKNKLTSIWNASTQTNPHPDFLLIAGDISKVPYYGNGNVTDMYYGEFTGNGDYIPEMYIGRIPAADTNELKNAVKKIIQYEKFEFADTNKFHSYALATAGSDQDHANYMNGQVRYAVDNYFTAANKINQQHFYYSYSYLTKTGALTSRKDSIIKIINKGTSFINYSGHGDSEGWQHIEIKLPDIPLLTNRNMYPFIISNACRTAQFSINQSFGNRLVVAADKGAVGFIGCSNDSYWDEDYYWSVGLGPITATPTYASKGLGAYDRYFHTHNESPSDWYTAMGQIVHAGNLSVSASTTNYKKYYWETYNLVGDPSMMPIIGTPIPFNVSLPDTLPNGMTTLSLTIEPFSYIAVSHSGTLWDASFANPAGSVILNMPGVSDDSCMVVITGQNRKPLFKTIYFSKIKSRYLNITGTQINDNIGNNNSLADHGETFYMAFSLSNLGLTGATGVSAILSTGSKLLTIDSDSVFVGDLAAGSDTTISEAFRVTLSNTIPDLAIISFDLLVKDQFSEKTYSFDINAHSPKLEIISMKIDDSSENNNFVAEPGEALNLIFKVRNYGSSNASGEFFVESADEQIAILAPNVKSGLLRFNEITEIIVSVKLSDETVTGAIISLSSSLLCDSLFVQKDFSFRVGKLRENFESSSFKVFPWINFGPNPWIVTATGPYEGAVSARSGVTPNNGTSKLLMRTIFTKPDSLRFYYRVSSELNYDYFSFRLNGAELLKESGETGWRKKTVPVPAGAAEMEWVYKKDESQDRGADAAWIDLIDFSVAGSLKYIEKDLKVAKITSPVQSDELRRELVTAKVLNVGHDTIRGFYLAYLNNNKIPIRQFFQNTILPYSDSVTVTFNIPTDLSRYGSYELTVYSYGNNDDYLANDTLKIFLENTRIDEPLLVFPNPFTDNLTIIINAPSADDVNISLVDLKGSKHLVMQRKLVSGENSIIFDSEIARLQSGLYYLQIRGSKIKISIPVLKMRQ